MRHLRGTLPAFVLATAFTAVPCIASTFTVGAISFDPYNTTGSTFDITNLTGALSSTFPDTSALVTTQLTFSNIMLTVDYQGGGTVTEDETQFGDDGFGGFLGQFDLSGSGLSITSASLTGDDSPGAVQLNDGSMVEIAQMFSATVTPSSGDTLILGDSATIDVTQTPEPAYAGLLSILLLAIGFMWRRKGARSC